MKTFYSSHDTLGEFHQRYSRTVSGSMDLIRIQLDRPGSEQANGSYDITVSSIVTSSV